MCRASHLTVTLAASLRADRVAVVDFRDRPEHGTMQMPAPVGWTRPANARDAEGEVVAGRRAAPTLSEAARAALAILLAQAPPAPRDTVGAPDRPGPCRTGSNASSC